MMRSRWVLLLLAAVTHVVAAESVNSLLAAERAFAASAPLLGVKAAFLGVLADDATLFRPGPVNARAWYSARPDVAPFNLEWAPEAAEVAADLGYTYGPYRLTPRVAEDKPGTAVGGHFFSIWIRPPRGNWRLLLDQGASHPLTAFPVRAEQRGLGVLAVAGGTADDLAAIDDRLNTQRAGHETRDAGQEFASSDAIALRAGHPPQSLRTSDVTTLVRGHARRSVLRVSADGRLGATAGHVDGVSAQAYQRAWRHEADGWKVVVDLIGD